MTSSVVFVRSAKLSKALDICFWRAEVSIKISAEVRPNPKKKERSPYTIPLLALVRTLRKDFDVDDVERKLSSAAHAMRISLSTSFPETGRAGLDVLHFAPLATRWLGLRFVTADRNTNVVVAVRMEQRSFTGRK